LAEEETVERLLLHALVDELGSPAIILDETRAKTTPCICYRIDEKEMCFSKGAIGTLRQEQIPIYCPTKIYRREGLARRVRLFKEAVAEAKEKIKGIPKGERLIPFLEAMGEALRKRGIKL